jgi:hypothetical protein
VDGGAATGVKIAAVSRNESLEEIAAWLRDEATVLAWVQSPHNVAHNRQTKQIAFGLPIDDFPPAPYIGPATAGHRSHAAAGVGSSDIDPEEEKEVVVSGFPAAAEAASETSLRKTRAFFDKVATLSTPNLRALGPARFGAGRADCTSFDGALHEQWWTLRYGLEDGAGPGPAIDVQATLNDDVAVFEAARLTLVKRFAFVGVLDEIDASSEALVGMLVRRSSSDPDGECLCRARRRALAQVSQKSRKRVRSRLTPEAALARLNHARRAAAGSSKVDLGNAEKWFLRSLGLSPDTVSKGLADAIRNRNSLDTSLVEFARAALALARSRDACVAKCAKATDAEL